KVHPDTRVSEIARLMSQHGVSGLPVVDAADRVVGIVTELDMMVRNTHFELPQFIFIFDAMIPLETPGHIVNVWKTCWVPQPARSCPNRLRPSPLMLPSKS